MFICERATDKSSARDVKRLLLSYFVELIFGRDYIRVGRETNPLHIIPRGPCTHVGNIMTDTNTREPEHTLHFGYNL